MEDILKQQHFIAHDNTKQLLNSYVTWFAFFWTINAGALGWLYSPQAMAIIGSQAANGRFCVSILFASLNVLGIGACIACWVVSRKLNRDALEAMEAWRNACSVKLSTEPAHGLFSANFANYVFLTGALTMGINIFAWAILPFVAAGKIMLWHG